MYVQLKVYSKQSLISILSRAQKKCFRAGINEGRDYLSAYSHVQDVAQYVKKKTLAKCGVQMDRTRQNVAFIELFIDCRTNV